MNDFGHRGTIIAAIAIVVVVVVVMVIDGDPRDANGTLDIEGTQILELGTHIKDLGGKIYDWGSQVLDFDGIANF